MRIAIVIGVILAILVTGAGCETGSGSDGGKVDIRGRITSITPAAAGATDTLGTILIEGAIEPDTSYDKASVKITTATKITSRTGGASAEAKFQDLQVGQQVEAKFAGPVAASYPVQATASRVVMIK